MFNLPKTLENLLEELQKLPGVGPRTAYRLAFFILNQPDNEVKALADVILKAKLEIRSCSKCFSLSDEELCPICKNGQRDPSIICVVEESKDVFAIEKVHDFKGVFHVLGGTLSPMDGIGPEQIRIKELLETVKQNHVREVIMATNPTVNGEATAMYIAQYLKELGVSVTRLASGLPFGGDIDFADEITLARALESRRPI